MDREREHLGITLEQRLDTIAVVHVEVDIHDPVPGIPCRGHGQGDVVVDAEARCSCPHRVMQPAGRREGVVGLARQDALDRPDGAACHERGDLVYAVERRYIL